MKKNWHFLVLLAIIIIAIFVRTYNYHNWLYFEADQARNAKNSIEAIEEGVQKIPLLGPKAGGTDFHLGPISYYFEYASGLIFGIDSPEVFAFSNLFFILLAIPLSYYFLNLFFVKEQSLLITAIFASSYLITQYSRFSWNPNSIIFWGLLFIVSVYKTVSDKNKKHIGWWLLLVSLSYGIVSQLHVMALLGFPLVALFFWFFYHPLNINWKFWAGAVLIFLVLYSPLIVYDVKTNGDNTREFIKAFSVKSEKRSFFEKIGKTTEQYGKYYSLSIFSINEKELKDVRWLGYLLISFSFGASFVLVRRNKKERNNVNSLPNEFFVLIGGWFLVFLLLNYKLAFEIDQPRFWFSSFFIPYILLAILIKSVWSNKIGKIISIFICIFIVTINLSAVLNWYEGMKNQDEKNRFSRKISSTSLIQSDFIAYGKMEESVDWIREESRSSKNVACFNSPSTYLASYKFIFDRNYPDFEAKRINKTIEMNLADNCDIFVIDHGNNSADEITNRFFQKGVKISLKKGYQTGLITIWKASFEK